MSKMELPTSINTSEISKQIINASASLKQIPQFVLPQIEIDATKRFSLMIPAAIKPIQEQLLKISINIPKINTDFIQQISAQIKSISTVAQQAVNKALQSIPQIDIDKIEASYSEAMFSSKWFPVLADDLDITFIYDVINIRNNSRTEKSLERNINKYVYGYFDEIKIKEIRAECIKLETNKSRLKILNQCLTAYKQRKYGLVVPALVVLWQGIIDEKAAETGYKTNKKSKEKFKELIVVNDLPQIISEFFDKYIMYDCHNSNEVITNVPGRNAISHGWDSTYAKRKTALNAILFTYFLLNLNQVQDVNEENLQHQRTSA